MCDMLLAVVSFLSCYRSIRVWGIESMNSRWLIVVGIVAVGCLTLEFCLSPVCGSSRISTFRFPYSRV